MLQKPLCVFCLGSLIVLVLLPALLESLHLPTISSTSSQSPEESDQNVFVSIWRRITGRISHRTYLHSTGTPVLLREIAVRHLSVLVCIGPTVRVSSISSLRCESEPEETHAAAQRTCASGTKDPLVPAESPSLAASSVQLQRLRRCWDFHSIGGAYHSSGSSSCVGIVFCAWSFS